MTTPSAAGEGARYVYDSAGNILQISPATTVAVSIADFSPRQGGVGQLVTVLGAGFSPAASLNTVQLGGVAAAVLSATSSELTFVVPAGATTGKISVASGSSAAISVNDFTVAGGVLVSDFTPKVGAVGTVLTVAGVNFDANPSGDTVSVGAGSGSVTSASSTALLAWVDTTATSGKVTVATGWGSGTSTADFFVVPDPYTPFDIGFTGRTSIGANTTVTVSQPEQSGLLLFDGIQGQALSLYVSANTLLDDTDVSVYTPGRVALFSGTVPSRQDHKFALPVLPSSGTYTVVVQPASPQTGKLDLRVLEDAAASLVVDGSASPLTLSSGQNGRYTFTGTSGDYLGFACTALTATPSGASVWFAVNKPDGSSLWTSSTTTATSWQWPQLPITGTYTLLVRPSGTAAASATALLSRTIAGVLATDGTLTRYQTTRPGQSGRYTFSATAGQNFTLATAGSTLPSGVILTVYQPNGISLASKTTYDNGNVKLDLSALPATGTYTAVLAPQGIDTGMADLRILTQATGVLVVGDPAKTLTLAAAQNGRYTFTGTAGDYLGLASTALTTTPSGDNVVFSVNKPDGTFLWSGNSATPTSWQLPQLPSTGTYTLLVRPFTAAAASLTVLLSRPISGALVVDGASTRYQTARPGQPGRYTFGATAGQSFTVEATAGSTWPNGIAITVYQPNGANIASTVTYTNGDVKLELSALPASGTYTVVLVPQKIDTGMVDLRVLTPVSGVLVVGDPPQTLTLAAAQNGRYTFTGTAGDYLGFACTALATTPSGGSVLFTINGPGGTPLWSGNTATPTNWQLPQLPSAGTYTLLVQPSGTAAASVVVLLSRPIAGVLAIDGASARYQTTRPGQSGRYTFNGAAGQSFTVEATAGATWPNGVAITVYQPSGAIIASAMAYSSNDLKLDLSVLPATGTYTVVLAPRTTNTGTVDLRIVTQASDVLAVGDPAKTLALSAAQNGRYTFTGTAGDYLGLASSALTTIPAGISVTFAINRPDGTLLWSGSATTPTSWQVPQLPASGTYTLLVRPTTTAAASLAVLLSRSIAGVLATDGASTRYQTTRAGQSGRYTFSAVAGQSFTDEATAGATWSNGVTIAAYQPSGASIASTTAHSGNDLKLDLSALPATGTYTVVLVPQKVDTGTVELRVLTQVTDVLVVGDPAKTLALNAAQNGRYTFTGTAGDYLGLASSALTTTPGGVSVSFGINKADGTSLWAGSTATPTSWQVPRLPAAGTYTLLVRPATTAAASVAVLLSRPITGVLATDGTSTRYQTTRPGQSGRFTFGATAGQSFTMEAIAGSTLPNGVSVAVSQPSGANIAGTAVYSNNDLKFDLSVLPATGTYTVVLIPQRIDTGTLDLRILPQPTGVLVIGDPPKTITLAAAQNGRHTFTGAAGDLLNVAVSALTTTPPGAYVAFTINRPDGTAMWSASTPSSTSWQVPVLPTSGTYTLRTVPTGTAAASLAAQLTRR